MRARFVYAILLLITTRAHGIAPTCELVLAFVRRPPPSPTKKTAEPFHLVDRAFLGTYLVKPESLGSKTLKDGLEVKIHLSHYLSIARGMSPDQMKIIAGLDFGKVAKGYWEVTATTKDGEQIGLLQYSIETDRNGTTLSMGNSVTEPDFREKGVNQALFSAMFARHSHLADKMTTSLVDTNIDIFNELKDELGAWKAVLKTPAGKIRLKEMPWLETLSPDDYEISDAGGVTVTVTHPVRKP